MKVDKERLGAILRSVEDSERNNFEFAVGTQVARDNVLPMFSIEGLGTIPVPVSIKDMNRLKKASEVAFTSQNSSMKIPGKVKKTCWQIDAAFLYRHGVTTENFFWQTVPSLAAEGLRQLAFDDTDIALVEARPLCILICERGGCYPLQRDIEQDPGMFGTMIIQIPVKNGYDGGYFQVEHRGKTRTFDHSNGSNRCFYTTIYYTGCGHQLTEVKNGWRLVLVFSLVWKWSRPLFMPLPGDESIVHAAKEIERLLSPWRLPDDAQQRLLAVPLDYTYTKNSLSFSGLKGRDRLTASLLRSVSFVDLHLASIHRRTKPINDVVLSVSRQCIGETDKEEFYTEAWITARTDSNFIFHGLEIDFDSEVVLPMIHSNSTDGNTELAKFGSNVRPSKNASYQEAMLVVWPKTSTIDLACQHGFVGALDHLEFLAKKLPKEEVLYVLGRTVAYCCAHPFSVWSSTRQSPIAAGEVTYRLLQLCIDLEATDQGLILLNLLADDLPPSPRSDLHQSDGPPEYEGMQSSQVANALAKLIHSAGWDSCDEVIYRLLTPTRIATQMEPMTAFVTSLLDQGLIHNAVEVADLVCPILFSSFTKLKPSANKSVAEMIFRLEEWAESTNPNRVKSYISMAQAMETVELCVIVVHIQKVLPQLIKRIVDTDNLYRKICQILVRRDLVNVRSTSANGDSILIDVIKSLVWFNDSSILHSFTRQITIPTVDNNVSLQAIATSTAVWHACLATVEGQKVLETIVDCRLRELSLLKPPVFSWEQADAVMPTYPEIESFLRSSQLSTTYSRKFANVNEARLWAVEVFGFGFEVLSSPDSQFFLQHRYSATVTVKKIAGGLAVCDITKNRRLYEYSVRQYELRRRELNELIERRRDLVPTAEKSVRLAKRVKFDLA